MKMSWGPGEPRELVGGTVDAGVADDRDGHAVAVGVGEAEVLAVDLRHRRRPPVHAGVAEDEGALLAEDGVGVLAVHVVRGGEQHARLPGRAHSSTASGARGRPPPASSGSRRSAGSCRAARWAIVATPFGQALHLRPVEDVGPVETEGGVVAAALQVRLPPLREVVDRSRPRGPRSSSARGEVGPDEAGARR